MKWCPYIYYMPLANAQTVESGEVNPKKTVKISKLESEVAKSLIYPSRPLHPMLSGSPITMAWHVLRLRTEKAASRHGL
jgi:hypothetical protein